MENIPVTYRSTPRTPVSLRPFHLFEEHVDNAGRRRPMAHQPMASSDKIVELPTRRAQVPGNGRRELDKDPVRFHRPERGEAKIG